MPPYLHASLHAELSQLAMAVGDHHRAASHAEVAWPLLERIHSMTDAYSLQVATAIAPLLDGDVDEAAALLERFGPPDGETAQVGARMTWQTAQAELALARGDARGRGPPLRRVVDLVTDGDVPGAGPAASPWVALAASAALVSRVRYGTSSPDARADELRDLVAGAVRPLARGHAVVHRPPAQRRAAGGPGRLGACGSVRRARARGRRARCSRSRTAGPTTAASR